MGIYCTVNIFIINWYDFMFPAVVVLLGCGWGEGWGEAFVEK